MACNEGAKVTKFNLNAPLAIMRLIIAIMLVAIMVCVTLALNIRVRRVVFEGAELSSQEALSKCKSFLLGQRILILRRDVSKFFAKEPFVAKADVRIVLPYTVVVVLKERKPIGLIKAGGKLYAISDDGLVYRHVENTVIEGISELPIFISGKFDKLHIGERLSDEDLKRLKRILSLLSSTGLIGICAQVEFGKAGELKLKIKDGSIFELGSDVRLSDRLAMAALIYAQLKKKFEGPVAIDARSMKGCTYRVLR